MRFLILLLLAVPPLISFGRLGETEEQLEQRFGTPLSRSMDRVIAQGKIISVCPVLTFKQDDYASRLPKL